MPRSALSKQLSLGLRAGDWVVVRSQNEILATLGPDCRLDGLQFQPEMFELCGRRLRVAKTAHKTCDTSIHNTGGRRLHDTVHLEGGRCDGGQHEGCQADCVFFWKEAWLRRAEGSSPEVPQRAGAPTPDDVMQARHAPGSDPADPVWVCQTTSIYEASEPLPWWDTRQYVCDVRGGNHSALHMARLLLMSGYRKIVHLGVGYRFWVGLYNRLQRWRGGKPYPEIHGQVQKGTATPAESLDLQPGEWVVVRSPKEIAATITPDGFNRGMRYDPEMLKYCDERYQVQSRVTKLIHEKTGKMTTMKTPCIRLENVYCRAELTESRLGCPRASSTYFREIWLRRAEPPAGAGSKQA
ncbi:hypothetical protein [Variovorax sp. YR752]|uniref:hypothetical protein n=1 Tax=Variovorax sp. YR752 TaxID=1884383 RepID=UPI00313780AA